jgi:hypothetical protein
MKALKIIGAILFIIGITFKFLHWPFGSIIFILGTLLLFILGLIFLIQNIKKDSSRAWINFSFSLILIYVLFRFQYWPCGPRIVGYPLLFILVFTFSLLSVFKIFQSKSIIKFRSIFFLLTFISFNILSFVHSYSIYYLVNLNSITNASTRDLNYKSWDKFSWFLYIADRKGEALDANTKAIIAAQYIYENYGDHQAGVLLKELKKHRILIENETWE